MQPPRLRIKPEAAQVSTAPAYGFAAISVSHGIAAQPLTSLREQIWRFAGYVERGTRCTETTDAKTAGLARRNGGSGVGGFLLSFAYDALNPNQRN